MPHLDAKAAAKEFISDMLSNRYPLDRTINVSDEEILEDEIEKDPERIKYIKDFCDSPRFADIKEVH